VVVVAASLMWVIVVFIQVVVVLLLSCRWQMCHRHRWEGHGGGGCAVTTSPN